SVTAREERSACAPERKCRPISCKLEHKQYRQSSAKSSGCENRCTSEVVQPRAAVCTLPLGEHRPFDTVVQAEPISCQPQSSQGSLEIERVWRQLRFSRR